MSISRTTWRIGLPALLAAALATVLLASVPGHAASAVTATAGGGSSHKPVIVLEHGAWADASSWAEVIAATQRPLVESAFGEPSGPPAWAAIPSWAVIGTADRVIPPAQLTFMAKRAGAHITDVNAGHLSMIADPEAVARVIEQAAESTS